MVKSTGQKTRKIGQTSSKVAKGVAKRKRRDYETMIEVTSVFNHTRQHTLPQALLFLAEQMHRAADNSN
eukprot:8321286-Lingulodinium_polyedra.AAC.1